MSTMQTTTFTPGNFYEYQPNRRWCKDGIAEANGHGLQDTYWGGTSSDYLTAEEAATATLFVDLAEFEEIDRYSKASWAWAQRRDDDRKKVGAQHGCCPRWFIRKGSEPDFGVRLKIAENALSEAESELESAKRTVEWKRRDLEELKTQHPAETKV